MQCQYNTSLLILCLVTFCVCCLGTVEIAQSESTHPAIEYVYPDQSIWTTKRNADGLLKNPLLRVAGQLFTQLQIDWSAKPYPANRMFERLQDGSSYFSILVKASRLKESCIFSTNAVTYSELRVYRKAGAAPIRKLEDFNGKQVITILGYSYGKIGKYLKDPQNHVVIYESPQHESAFTMLSHSRADYLLDYSGPSEEVLLTQPIANVTHDVLTRLDVYLVLSKKYPDAHKFMSLMEKAVQNIDVTQWGLKQP